MNRTSKQRPLYGDNIGYVQIVDWMGDEFTPAEDARISTGRGRLGPEKDTALQDRLLADGHTSPFEGVVVKIEMCVPLFVLREIDRHRTLTKVGDSEEFASPEENGRRWFARNEMSGRYIKLPSLYYFPHNVRFQNGVSPSLEGGKEIQQQFLSRASEVNRMARELYDWAVENGIERGMARMFNTQNQYTKIRMTGSMKNWFDFLRLRLPSDVLWECRRVAQEIDGLFAELFGSLSSSYWKHNPVKR